MADDLTQAKNWIYVFCTAIQTVLAFIGLVFVRWWWDRRKTKDEWKRDDQRRREEDRQREIQREENRQKEDAQTIAKILSENYYEVEDVFQRLKGIVDKLSEKRIVSDLTEFHVLLYKCRNSEKLRKSEKEYNIIRAVVADVEEIMKFFDKFWLNLLSTKKNIACSDDVKEEFSKKITEMGNTIYPFMDENGQNVIEKVSTYFEGASTAQEPATRTVQECPDRQDESPSNRRYPRSFSTIENEILYLKYFSYQGNGVMALKFKNIPEKINTLMALVELGEMQGKEDELLKKIHELEQVRPVGGLLHSIRLIMFKLSEDDEKLNDKAFEEFKKYVEEIVAVDLSPQANVKFYQRMLNDIIRFAEAFGDQLKPSMLSTETKNMLENVWRMLDPSRQRHRSVQVQQK